MSAWLAALGCVWFAALQEDPKCELTLVAREPHVRPGNTFQVALKFKVEPKWHIYWMNPGDTGVSTNVDWKLPAGFKVQSTTWSRPHRFESSGVVSYGYEDEAFAVATIAAPRNFAGPTVRIGAAADWLICKETCIIGNGSANLTLPVRATAAATKVEEGPWAKLSATLPKAFPIPMRATAYKDHYEVRFENSPVGFVTPRTAYFFAFDSNVVDHAKPQELKVSAGEVTLRLYRSSFEKSPAKVLEGVLDLHLGNGPGAAYTVRIPIVNASKTRRSQ